MGEEIETDENRFCFQQGDVASPSPQTLPPDPKQVTCMLLFR